MLNSNGLVLIKGGVATAAGVVALCGGVNGLFVGCLNAV